MDLCQRPLLTKPSSAPTARGGLYDYTPNPTRHRWYCSATALLGLASGIAGTFAVLRKESLIGDGLSHAALPGVVIAFLLTGIKDIEVLIIGAALSSITAAWLITNHRRKQ